MPKFDKHDNELLKTFWSSYRRENEDKGNN